ncbi:MAG: ABC transporter ATP-binding protein [Chloroflexi bacterium]|nr:ABC transporter ATP-binding protein [Chloroflexota bacterium]
MLEVRDVWFSYGEKPVLRGIDLEVGDGEIVGIVGPNGSGKSTLIKLIGGVLHPEYGQVRWAGEDLSILSPKKRARLVASVPQSPSLPESFTAFDLVMMGRTPYLGLLRGEGLNDLAAVRRAMEVTGVWALANQPIGKLSGGERQRVLVARALAQETPILLLDEPTASLDIAYQVAIMDTVKAVQRVRGGAIVVAIHDLILAAQYCHRIGILKDGAFYALGTPTEVLTGKNVREGYGASVLILEHPVSGLPMVLPVPEGASAQRQDGD